MAATFKDGTRGKALHGLFALAVLAVVFAGLILDERSASADTSYDTEELEFLKIINEYRQDKGLPTLILSDALTDASERHSEDMGRHDFFAHESVKSSYFPAGSKPWDRMSRSNYDYPNAARAENLAAGYETAKEAFEAWRASPGHDRNMLDGDQRVIGIARLQVPGSEYDWYWTTDFGSEKDPTSHAPGEPPSRERQKAEKEQASEKDRDRDTDRDGVENGSMEESGIWEQKTARDGKSLLDQGMARLGGSDDAEDEISQKVRIQKGQRLVYRVRVETEEEDHPADGLIVHLADESGKHLATLESQTDADAKAPEDGWVEKSVDLSRFTGKTVKLGFLAKTDGEQPTTFYVDDVALK